MYILIWFIVNANFTNATGSISGSAEFSSEANCQTARVQLRRNVAQNWYTPGAQLTALCLEK